MLHLFWARSCLTVISSTGVPSAAFCSMNFSSSPAGSANISTNCDWLKFPDVWKFENLSAKISKRQTSAEIANGRKFLPNKPARSGLKKCTKSYTFDTFSENPTIKLSAAGNSFTLISPITRLETAFLIPNSNIVLSRLKV